MRIISYGIERGGCLDDCTYIRFEGISVDREEAQKIIDSCIERVDLNGMSIYMNGMPTIKKVIFNKPATIVLWEDGTKTVVKCSDRDLWNPEKGLAMCIIKKICGNDNSYHKIFKKWIPEDEPIITVDLAYPFNRCGVIMPRHLGESTYKNMCAIFDDIFNTETEKKDELKKKRGGKIK